MQPAKSGYGYDTTTCIGSLRCWTARRCLLLQREMGSIFMVVADVFIHQPFQMPPTYYDHVVEQVSSAATNPSLGDAVLPRTSVAGPFTMDAEALHRADHLLIEVRCPVEDQVTRERIVWKGLPQLLDDPMRWSGVWLRCSPGSGADHARLRKSSTPRQMSASAR